MRPRYQDLFERMRDPDPVAADAAFDAVLFDREQALPDLIECLDKARKDPTLRFLCVQLLGFCGSQKGVPPLVAALEDKDASVRAEACRSLEDLRAKNAVAALEARFNDVDPEVRTCAREAVEAILGGKEE